MNAGPTMAAFQTVKGFRDFLPEDCALRNYIFDRWRRVARGYGFVEYEGPLVEPTDLYKKKSGDEITGQLFNFLTKGDEDVSLRPEVTPTLARLVAANQRNFSKPLKWFQIGSCFRYEKPQRGRTREFIQFNVDIVGDNHPANADAELVAFAIDTMRAFGFEEGDFVVRLSNRRLWLDFLAEHRIADEHSGTFLQIIDKMERAPKEVTAKQLESLGLSFEQVESHIHRYLDGEAVESPDSIFAELKDNLTARGLWKYVKIDPGIVRGLAYYTGTVFEVFDLKHQLRAIAGGGRYDNLVGHLSDGAVQMNSCGFAMGDVVLTELINRHEVAKEAAEQWKRQHQAPEVYLVVADDSRRTEALGILQQLRSMGLRVDYALSPSKIGKQFQTAESLNARFAVVVGAEYPLLTVKTLRTRDQMEVSAEQLPDKLAGLLSMPESGPLVAARTA
jgi:histidyl-tRNA synthetase